MRKSLPLYLLWLACHVGGAPTTVFAQSTKTVYKDQDGDGHGDPFKPKSTNNPSQDYVTLADDCNDKDPSIFKGAKEIKDRKDNDCDGMIDEVVWFEDKDKDGYGSTVTKEAVTQPTGYVHRDGDPNDNDPTIYPNATDICDGKDNDGNGIVDDGGTRVTYYRDADGDTFGDPAVTILSCTEVIGYVTNNKDFDDRDATRYPNAPELCDGKDNDNDGSGDPLEDWYVDNDGDTYGAGPATRSCAVPSTTKQWVRNNEDADDTDNKVYPGAVEVCDNKDNNQNGTVDEGFAKQRFYRDADTDTYGDAYNYVEACYQPDGYITNNFDCDDTRFGVFRHEYYADNDGDGYGAGTKVTACPGLEPAGHVKNNTDANDNDNTVYPGATEICDGKDNDQDGMSDEFIGATWYRDLDEDGFGDPNNTIKACSPPEGIAYVSNDDDCNDNDNTIHPGATEVCDGKDNDCDGQVDDNAGGLEYYRDADGDNFGDPRNTVRACSAPPGYVSRSSDCDDTDSRINPDGREYCDNKDNNCNGQVDEPTSDAATFYRDADGDGWGNSNISTLACTPPPGYVFRVGDCNDADSEVHPDGREYCDGEDNNCDGVADNSCSGRVAAAGSYQAELQTTTLYPNPVKDEVTVVLSKPASELKSTVVSSVINDAAMHNVYTVIGDRKIRIKVGHLKSGVYVVRIEFNNGMEIIKFLKN